jgi:RNA exonuclease 1
MFKDVSFNFLDLFGILSDDVFFYLGTTPKSSHPTSADLPPITPPPSKEALASTLQELNAHLSKIYSNLPPRTALIIFTGHSDPRRMAALNARKSQFESALRAGGGAGSDNKSAEESVKDVKWTSQDGRDLEEAVELARRGLAFLGVKY